MSREINIAPAHIPLFSVLGCITHFAENQNSGMWSWRMEVVQQTRCPAATRSSHLSASPPSSHTLTKPGGEGGGGKKEKRLSREYWLPPTCVVKAAQSRTAWSFYLLIYLFFSWRAFLKKLQSAKVWHGVSGGLIRAVSVTTVGKKEMRPHHYYFPPFLVLSNPANALWHFLVPTRKQGRATRGRRRATFHLTHDTGWQRALCPPTKTWKHQESKVGLSQKSVLVSATLTSGFWAFE